MTTDEAPHTDLEDSKTGGRRRADPFMTIRAVLERPSSWRRDFIGLIGVDHESLMPPYDVICSEPTYGPGDMSWGKPMTGTREIASSDDQETTSSVGSS